MNTSNQEFSSIDEYIDKAPQFSQARLIELREIIKKLIPNAEEAISYGMPTFKLNGKNVVHFAAFKNHIGFYPLPSGVAYFQDLTKEFETSKGTVQFPYDKPLPADIVKEVIEFRLGELKAE